VPSANLASLARLAAERTAVSPPAGTVTAREGPSDDAIGPILRTVTVDRARLTELAPLLSQHGLMRILEGISSRFEELSLATQTPPGARKFVHLRETADGFVPAFDFVLKVYMAQSAHAQFLHCVGHLLRGHSFEVFGHAANYGRKLGDSTPLEAGTRYR
jgi:hypothetical protein